ncbi:aquaporin-like protein [Zopfochytrium polystomum]|nr:aquaporin-like protein [Zopfochytrium polystomum]
MYKHATSSYTNNSSNGGSSHSTTAAATPDPASSPIPSTSDRVPLLGRRPQFIPPKHSELTNELVQAAGEFVGTLFFLFILFAAIQASLLHEEHFLLSISLSAGFALTSAVWLTYRISGGALNPAVILALLLVQKISFRKAGLYLIGQLLGSTTAAFFVSFMAPDAWGREFQGANKVAEGTSLLQAFCLEAVLTAGLVLVVLFVAVEKSKATFLAPLVIGLYVIAAHLVAIPYTNASLNPARTFGSALISGNWSDHWLFWLAPLSGASIAAGLYKAFKLFNFEVLNPHQEDDHEPLGYI